MDGPMFEARRGQCLSKADLWPLLLMYLLVPSTHGTIVDHRRVRVFGSEPMLLSYYTAALPPQQPLPWLSNEFQMCWRGAPVGLGQP